MTILWLILKIILGVLGLLLSLFLCILLGLLFLPLEYKLEAEKYETIAYAIHLRIFYLISILYDSQKHSSIRIQLLGKTIKTVSLEGEEEVEELKDINLQKEEKINEEKIYLKEVTSKEATLKKEEAPRIRSVNTGKIKKDKEKTKEKQEAKEKRKAKDGIRTGTRWLERIKTLWNLEDRAPFLRFCKILLKNLWYAIRPKVLSFRLIFGLENPADTGMLLAKLMALYPFYAPYGDIIGDFENTRLEGDIRLLGKTNLYRFIKPLIIFITHKEVRHYIKIIMNIGKDNEDGIKI